MVRARVEDDLKRLLARIKTRYPDTDLKRWKVEIIETKRADYRYRLIIPRHVWSWYLTLVADEIDYTNVKDTLAPMKTEGPRHKAMMSVWSAMYALQPGGRAWGSLVADHDDRDDDWWKDETLWERHSGPTMTDEEWADLLDGEDIDCPDCGTDHDPNEHCPTH